MILPLFLGIGAGFIESPLLMQVEKMISEITLKTLQLIALPVLFLSICSTLASMNGMGEARTIVKKILKYTLLTTILAALVAMILFVLFISPLQINLPIEVKSTIALPSTNYIDSFLSIYPSNFTLAFAENNVLGIVLIAAALGLSILSLPKTQKEPLETFFSSLFSALLKITTTILKFLPIGVFAFTALFIQEMIQTKDSLFSNILFYAGIIVVANLIQGLVIIPLILRYKKISSINLFKQMKNTLTIAFFSKSSNACLPTAIKTAKENLGMNEKIAKISFPLCSTINMNGCAAFIFITTLFVAKCHGIEFNIQQMLVWILIATIAAIGNAGIPMGCFFLSSTILTSMNIPLVVMGFILPLYTWIDMIETALNVWSDSAVSAIVDKEYGELDTAPSFSSASS